MAEYIEREAVVARIKQTFCSDCDSYNGVRCRACLIDDALLQIEDEPAADVAPVVHCEDCKHWKNHRTGLLGIEVGDCHNYDFPFHCESQPITRATDFCSYGERKEGHRNETDY